jgi:prolyl-tRNA editing enzyme YbaK/EbsC (Cys-tRNA(Pro) deacylase)
VRTIVVRRRRRSRVRPGCRRSAIDWAKLRAHLGVSRLSLPDAEEAMAATGYERGAITPFGSSTSWPVIADASVVAVERVAIGGGARGVNLHMASADLLSATSATVVDVTKPG